MVDNKETKPVRCGCGGEPEIWHNFGGLAFLSCKSCEITTKGYDNHFQAIEAWNRAMGAKDINVPDKEQIAMVWKPAKNRPAYEKGICSCGYVLSVLQRDFVFCPHCGAKLDWSAASE